jgi:hypothetical protein
MRLPVIRGVIERRILANFRVDPDVLARILPNPFRPKLVNGWGMAGICLIRLGQIRPRVVPAVFGLSSENAAHRIAVEWDDSSGTQSGVYIPRRDTSSRLNALAGGRLFPGEHHLARFDVRESDGEFHVSLRGDNVALLVEGHLAIKFPQESIFATLEEASSFFEAGALGYSATARPGHFDGLELRSLRWRVEPLAITRVESSFFSNQSSFPSGSVHFDCALLMRGIEHEWHSRDSLCCSTQNAAA